MNKNKVFFVIFPDVVAVLLGLTLLLKAYYGKHTSDELTLSPIVIAASTMFFYQWLFSVINNALKERQKLPVPVFSTLFYALSVVLLYLYFIRTETPIYILNYLTFILILFKTGVRHLYSKKIPFTTYFVNLCIVATAWLGYRLDWTPLFLLGVSLIERVLPQWQIELNKPGATNLLGYINTFSFIGFIWLQLFVNRTPNNELFVFIMGIILASSLLYLTFYQKLVKSTKK